MIPTLSELLRRQQEATPGPWKPGKGMTGLATHICREHDHAEESLGSMCFQGDPNRFSNPHDMVEQEEADARFIVAARNFDFASLQTQYEAMRSFIQSAGHSKACRIDFPSEGYGSISADGKCDFTVTNPGQTCTCGLSALRASLDTKARGHGK